MFNYLIASRQFTFSFDLNFFKRSFLHALFFISFIVLFSIESQAIWIVGKRLTSYPGIYCPEGKEFDNHCCVNLVGECGSLVKWKGLLSEKQFVEFEKGHLIFFEDEPDVPIAIDADIKITKGFMNIKILKMKGTDKFFFNVPQDTILEAGSSKLLGYKEVIIKKGDYQICYNSKNPLGSTSIKVAAKK